MGHGNALQSLDGIQHNLKLVGDLSELFAFLFDAPLDTGGGPRYGRSRSERAPGESHLDTPAAVAVARVVEGTLHPDGGAQARNVPTVVGLAAFAVRLGQEEVPPGVEGVDLEFE